MRESLRHSDAQSPLDDDVRLVTHYEITENGVEITLRAVTPAPSNMTVVPTEVWENRTSITIEKREILPDTGGNGKWRGGDGQEVVFRNDTGHLLDIALMGQRTEFAAKGLQGGGDGALRRYEVNGQPVDPKSRVELSPGDRISMREAGGGGFGNPS